jgi:Arc/MetJ-type ribon-helix-helix transcriptional regulator
MPVRKLRTTVALSEDLIEAMDALVQEGEAESRNDFLEKALRNQLAASRRAAIDAEFAEMANDRSYQREAVQVAEDFAEADWEALQTSAETRPRPSDRPRLAKPRNPLRRLFGELLQHVAVFAHHPLGHLDLDGKLRVIGGQLDAGGRLDDVKHIPPIYPQALQDLLRQDDANRIADRGELQGHRGLHRARILTRVITSRFRGAPSPHSLFRSLRHQRNVETPQAIDDNPSQATETARRLRCGETGPPTVHRRRHPRLRRH